MGENMISYSEMGDAGVGTIQASDTQTSRLDEFTNRVGSGEFHVTTDEIVPVCCVDGRCARNERYLPCSAGGTETMTIADDLTTSRFGADDDLVMAHVNMLSYITDQGHLVGSHVGTHANVDLGTADCGASDRLPEVYEYIRTHAERLKQLVVQLGFSDDDIVHESIVGRAHARTTFPRSADMVNAVVQVSGEDSRDVLEGEHAEVLIVINMREHTTLDHHAVQREFGDNYMAFNVDAWTFREAARMISDSADEAVMKTVAMLYYNLATAGVLCGPRMRVTVLH